MNIPTVLFVDDEAYILEALKRLFIDGDFKVLTAANAEEALDCFQNNEIAVIVTDNQMSGMRGIDLLSKVREISPDTIRILMTGYADLNIAVEAINTGEVFKLIVKPWRHKEFENILQEALNRYSLLHTIKRSDEATLLSIAQTVELKDPYTRGHCDRVARYAMLIAEALGYSDDDKSRIKYGSWLHDCGKIGVPEAILNKTGCPDSGELGVLRKHPVWGADVARQAQLDNMIVNIILHHHERYGGGGYPEGLSGERIPREARIVAVADVFDALTTDRPYRKGFSPQQAFDVLETMKDVQLDAELVEIFKGKFDSP